MHMFIRRRSHWSRDIVVTALLVADWDRTISRARFYVVVVRDAECSSKETSRINHITCSIFIPRVINGDATICVVTRQ